MIEGKPLKAGTYGFFIALGDTGATIIFSNNYSSCDSSFYSEKEDVLQATVKTIALNESVECLKYEFIGETEKNAFVALIWEKLKIPFTIEVDNKNTQLESFQKELATKLLARRQCN